MDPAALAAVRAAYDAVSRAYANEFLHELDRKPYERALLGAFAEMVRGAGPVADLGAGCGHVARFLHERGVDAFGVDLSPRMRVDLVLSNLVGWALTTGSIKIMSRFSIGFPVIGVVR